MVVTDGGQVVIEKFRELLEEYDAYIAEIAPFTYRDGVRMKALRERKEKLLVWKPGEIFEEELATWHHLICPVKV